MKTGLHSLPTELKQQIVQCCADQDDLLACAFGTLIDEDIPIHTRLALHGPLHRAVTKNRSLDALAAVSREWNELAAPVLFEVLPVKKMDPSTRDDNTERHIASSRMVDLIRALPLHTPELVGDLRFGLRHIVDRANEMELDPDDIRAYTLEYEEREKVILGLLERAEAIVHSMAVPQDLLSSFERISGANLKTLEVNAIADDTHPAEFALILDKFPNLDSLTVHIELFNDHGALKPVLLGDPATLPHSPPPPRLRQLVLTGTYVRSQLPPGAEPSSAPLLRFAHRFAETLRSLDLEIGCADHEADNNEQLVLRDLASASATLLASIDSTTFPALSSRACVTLLPLLTTARATPVSISPTASRLAFPGSKSTKGSPAFESISHRLFEWYNRRQSEQRPDLHIYRHTESTYPEPVRYPYSKEDAADLSERVQRTLEHLNEWFRSARDAQDADTLAQMRDSC
ncbi:hypothetical protein RHOSPDRAFT_35152 [Rhodotorula sp. JG-1b]|nr:hypothetical protein RHOSPDRAFT_35152 [Rhodotorula sp. JG-1b]